MAHACAGGSAPSKYASNRSSTIWQTAGSYSRRHNFHNIFFTPEKRTLINADNADKERSQNQRDPRHLRSLSFGQNTRSRDLLKKICVFL
jgi:hypothetical protein